MLSSGVRLAACRWNERRNIFLAIRCRTTSPTAVAVATVGMARTGCSGKHKTPSPPLGPFIVPKEFIKDPQKLAVQFRLSGKVMQDSNTERMTHNVFEMLSYAS